MSSWSSDVARLIRPSFAHHKPLHCPQRYPANNIWKRSLVQAVAQDLSDARHGRRFMRVDDFGLGGMVMYKIDADMDWETMFGDGGPHRGMELEDLLDEVQAKVVYAPLYACTSFVTGQLMNAFLRDRKLCPVNVGGLRGFSVSLDAFDTFEYCSVFHDAAQPILTTPTLSDEPGLVPDDDNDSVYSLGPGTPGKSTVCFNLPAKIEYLDVRRNESDEENHFGNALALY